jgi:hypothetical protein
MLNVISTCLGCLGVIIVATGFSNILGSVLNDDESGVSIGVGNCIVGTILIFSRYIFSILISILRTEYNISQTDSESTTEATDNIGNSISDVLTNIPIKGILICIGIFIVIVIAIIVIGNIIRKNNEKRKTEKEKMEHVLKTSLSDLVNEELEKADYANNNSQNLRTDFDEYVDSLAKKYDTEKQKSYKINDKRSKYQQSINLNKF